MSEITLNPYPILGTQFSSGMDYIIANLSSSPTVDDLVQVITDYIPIAGYFTSPLTTIIQVEIQSVAYNAINSYVNGLITSIDSSLYDTAQNRFIDMIIGRSLTNYITVDAIKSRILDIQDNISKSGLTVEEQTPLFLASMMGQTAYDYLLSQINLGGISDWSPYFDSALSSADANLPFWTAASMEGALVGARSTFRGMIEQTTEIVSIEIISALIASLTLAAGMPIFQWTKRIQNGQLNTLLTLNMQTMGDVNK